MIEWLSADERGVLTPHPPRTPGQSRQLSPDAVRYIPDTAHGDVLDLWAFLDLTLLWMTTIAPPSVRYVARLVVAIRTGTTWAEADSKAVECLVREMEPRLPSVPPVIEALQAMRVDESSQMADIDLDMSTLAAELLAAIESTGRNGRTQAMSMKHSLDEALQPTLPGAAPVSDGAFWWLAKTLPHNPALGYSPFLMALASCVYDDTAAIGPSLTEDRLRQLGLIEWLQAQEPDQEPEPIAVAPVGIPYRAGLVLFSLLKHFGQSGERDGRTVKIPGGKEGFASWVNKRLPEGHAIGGATAGADAWSAADWLYKYEVRLDGPAREIKGRYIDYLDYSRGGPGKPGYVEIEVGQICIPGYERAKGLLILPYTLAPVVCAGQHRGDAQRVWNLIVAALARGPAHAPAHVLSADSGVKASLIEKWTDAWVEQGALVRVRDTYEWGQRGDNSEPWQMLMTARVRSKNGAKAARAAQAARMRREQQRKKRH